MALFALAAGFLAKVVFIVVRWVGSDEQRVVGRLNLVVTMVALIVAIAYLLHRRGTWKRLASPQPTVCFPTSIPYAISRPISARDRTRMAHHAAARTIAGIALGLQTTSITVGRQAIVGLPALAAGSRSGTAVSSYTLALTAETVRFRGDMNDPAKPASMSADAWWNHLVATQAGNVYDRTLAPYDPAQDSPIGLGCLAETDRAHAIAAMLWRYRVQLPQTLLARSADDVFDAAAEEAKALTERHAASIQEVAENLLTALDEDPEDGEVIAGDKLAALLPNH